MTTTALSDDNDDLRRIADALERIANRYTPISEAATVSINLAGNYAGTKETLAKQISDIIREEIKRGMIPPGWAAA